MNKDTEEIVCNYCNSNEYKIKYRVDNFKYVRCKKCGLVYVNPRLKTKSINSLYIESYFAGNGFDKSINYKKDFEEKLLKPDLDNWDIATIKSFLPKQKGPHVLLDVGCGMGLFLQKANENDFLVEGLELSDYATEFARSKGLKVKNASIDTVEIRTNYYDSVVMKEVIEHLSDPKNALKKIYNSLKSGGVLFITTGNYNCPERIVRGNKWHYFMPKGHLYIFSNITIKNYLKETGFAKIYVTQQGDLLMNFLLKLGIIEINNYTPRNLIKRIIFNLVRFINHFVSSGMRIYAIK